MSDFTEIYNLAFNEEYKQVDDILVKRGNSDAAIMGFSNKQLELLNKAITQDDIKEIYKSLSETDKKRVKELEVWIWKCVDYGACLLWGIQQPDPGYTYKQGSFYNKNISMLKGPGDVPKGSFAPKYIKM